MRFSNIRSFTQFASDTIRSRRKEWCSNSHFVLCAHRHQPTQNKTLIRGAHGPTMQPRRSAHSLTADDVPHVHQNSPTASQTPGQEIWAEPLIPPPPSKYGGAAVHLPIVLAAAS